MTDEKILELLRERTALQKEIRERMERINAIEHEIKSIDASAGK